MKHVLSLLFVIALVALPANAVGLRMFFAPEGVGPTDPLGGISPTIGNPVVNGSARLYIWAQIVGGTGSVQYISDGFNVVADGGAAISAANVYNYTDVDFGVSRWQAYNTGNLTANKLDNVRLACPPGNGYFGIRDKSLFNVDAHYDAATKSTLIGYVDVTGTAGRLFFQVGDLGIIRTGGSWESVYFGTGDDGLGLMGNSKQKPTGSENGFVADASFVPEPTSLLLIALGGLVLRRR